MASHTGRPQCYVLYCEQRYFLWCDGCDDSRKRQKDESPTPSKRACKETEVDGVCNELKELHSKKYSEPQYRLWARMIVNGIHASKDEPPQVPMIVGTSNTRTAKKSLEDTTSTTMAAFAKVVTQRSVPESPQQQPSNSIGISPGKAVEIRGKCYAQLAS